MIIDVGGLRADETGRGFCSTCLKSEGDIDSIRPLFISVAKMLSGLNGYFKRTIEV